jgi:hypothetical protein
VITEVIRVSMNAVEFIIIVGFAFVFGCAAGWWTRGR